MKVDETKREQLEKLIEKNISKAMKKSIPYAQYKKELIERTKRREKKQKDKFKNSLKPLTPAELYLVKSAILDNPSLSPQQKELLIMKVQNITV